MSVDLPECAFLPYLSIDGDANMPNINNFAFPSSGGARLVISRNQPLLSLTRRYLLLAIFEVREGARPPVQV